MAARLRVTREQVLAFRRRVGCLGERLPSGPHSLRRAAWAGLQDSVPRAALLSLHARVTDTLPGTWEDASLVQLWGPRFGAYVVPAADRAVFSLGRLPDDAAHRRRAVDLADRLEGLLQGEKMAYGRAGRALGVPPNTLRYAAPTGRVLMRWDGARQPVVWTVPAPEMEPGEARLELARRYLHVFGPGTSEGFARWAGIPGRAGIDAFTALGGVLAPVQTPIGTGWILAGDEAALRADPEPAAPARLLPSGDAYFLLQGEERRVLLPDVGHRSLLWTARVWPGALLVQGEIAGTWRRSQESVTVDTWKRLSRAQRASVEAEAASLPLPRIQGEITVRWGD